MTWFHVESIHHIYGEHSITSSSQQSCRASIGHFHRATSRGLLLVVDYARGPKQAGLLIKLKGTASEEHVWWAPKRNLYRSLPDMLERAHKIFQVSSVRFAP